MGVAINLGDEDEVDGEMNMKDGHGEYYFFLVDGWDCKVVIYEMCMGK